MHGTQVAKTRCWTSSTSVTGGHRIAPRVMTMRKTLIATAIMLAMGLALPAMAGTTTTNTTGDTSAIVNASANTETYTNTDSFNTNIAESNSTLNGYVRNVGVSNIGN